MTSVKSLTTRRYWIASALVFAVAACQSGRTAPSDAASGSLLESFTTSPSIVGPFGSVQFIVTATHAEQLAGGTLQDAASHQVFGVFSAPGGAGTYVLDLTWDQINAIHPLSIPRGGAHLDVVTIFEDAAGEQTSRMLSVRISPSSNATPTHWRNYITA
jgi:hypothetical protein